MFLFTLLIWLHISLYHFTMATNYENCLAMLESKDPTVIARACGKKPPVSDAVKTTANIPYCNSTDRNCPDGDLFCSSDGRTFSGCQVAKCAVDVAHKGPCRSKILQFKLMYPVQ